MGGFLGIGGSSEKTDRNRQLDATGKLDSVFNWALPESQNKLAQGNANVSDATGYWQKLLNSGRSDIAQMAAPATNSYLDSTDASRADAAAHGTQRSGGSAAVNRETDADASKNIDDILTKSLFGGRSAAATSLASTGLAQGNQGLNLAGLGTNAINDVMKNATESRKTSNDIASQQGQGIGQLLGMLAFL